MLHVEYPGTVASLILDFLGHAAGDTTGFMADDDRAEAREDL